MQGLYRSTETHHRLVFTKGTTIGLLLLGVLVGATSDVSSSQPATLFVDTAQQFETQSTIENRFVDFSALIPVASTTLLSVPESTPEKSMAQAVPADAKSIEPETTVSPSLPVVTPQTSVSQIDQVAPLVPAPPVTVPDEALEAQLVSGMNDVRTENGLSPLHESELLVRTAREYASTLGAHGTITHFAEPDCGITCRFSRYDVPYISWGENLGWWQSGSLGVDTASLSDGLMREWLRSSGHRENILSDTYTAVGVGVRHVRNEWFVVVHFGGV